MSYYYTYKITLLKGRLAGKYYFGQHTTDDLNDGYAGSGAILRRYYKRHGKVEHQTYIKEIIALYDNLEELNQAEYNLIGDRYKNDPMCLNLRAGGDRPGYSDEMRRKISEATKGEKNPFYGKHHSEETKRKISEAHKGKESLNKGKPRTKQKWITPDGDIVEMNISNVKQYHKDWQLYE